jgi:hypothetical protein
MQTIRDVEIFQEGDHKAGPWDAASLNAMARNAAALRDLLTPPLVIGHGDSPTAFGAEGEPAFGIAENIRVEYRVLPGETEPRATLVADLHEVPDTIAALIHAGAYRTISPEIYVTLPQSLADRGVTGPVIKRVSVLGGAIPEVKTLRDVTDIYRLQVEPSKFAESRPARRLKLAKVIDLPGGVSAAFSDVIIEGEPMQNKKVKCADVAKAAKKFADAVASDATISRDELLAILGGMGIDTSTITDAVPDQFLMEVARVTRAMIEEMTAANATKDVAEAEASGAKQAVEEIVNEKSTDDDDDENKNVAAMSDKRIEDRVAKLVEAGLARFAASAAQAREQLAKEIREANKASIAMFCEEQRRAGRLLPAEIDAGLPELLEKLAARDSVVKFSDGTETSLLEKIKKIIAARPEVARFSDVIKAPATIDADVEIAKVARFAEGNADALKKAGRTPAQMVETFKRIREKDPGFTADKLIGPLA